MAQAVTSSVTHTVTPSVTESMGTSVTVTSGRTATGLDNVRLDLGTRSSGAVVVRPAAVGAGTATGVAISVSVRRAVVMVPLQVGVFRVGVAGAQGIAVIAASSCPAEAQVILVGGRQVLVGGAVVAGQATEAQGGISFGFR